MVASGQVSSRKVYISSIARALQMRLTDGKNPPKGLSVFHSVNAPSISISRYLQRILKYAEFPLDFLIVSLIYIDRFLSLNQNYHLGELNIHRILIASIVLAIKYSSDFYLNNTMYAKIGGISLKELNLLEKEFLVGIGYQLYIEPDVYQRYVMENHYIQRKLLSSLNRSAATHTEDR